MTRSVIVRPWRGWMRQPRARAVCTFAALTAFSLSANAVPVEIDTSFHVGEAAIFSVTLLDGDFASNTSAEVTNFVTDAQVNGAPQCGAVCQNVPPFCLDDTGGFAELTQDISVLGNFISFDLTFSHEFSNVSIGAASDLVIGELLNIPGFQTNLSDLSAPIPYEDAVFVASLATNNIVGAAGITSVPTPGTLALLTAGIVFLPKRGLCAFLRSLSTIAK